MKGKFKSLLLAAMALVLFAGCSNVALDNASVEGSDSSDKCVLSIGVKGLASSGSGARTIAVGAWAPADKTTYKIEGFSARGYTLDETALTFNTSYTSTTTTIELEYDVWSFTLHAYDDGVEVMNGRTTVDLRKTNSVVFELSSKNVDSNGSMEVTLTVSSSVIKSYEAGLYDVNTGKQLYAFDPADVDANPTVVLSKEGIAPGDYILKFIPYDKASSVADKESLNTWSDVIVIKPGRQTTGSANITGLMEPPEAPADFTVELDSDSLNDNDDYYTVNLSWRDKSTNEENFILYIYNIDESETLLKKFDGTNGNVFYGDTTYWVDGNLGMSRTTCKVKLHTGHKYEMKLSAKNRVGESDVVDRTAGDFDTSCINQKKITYHLMGATIDGETDVVRYETYPGTDAFTLWQPASLAYNEHAFKGWSADANSSTTTLTTENTYEDVEVFAVYDDKVKPGFSFTLADETSKTITVTVSTESAGVTQTDNTFVVNTANASVWSGKITFTISDDISPKKIEVLSNGNKFGSNGNSKTCDVPLTKFRDGGDFQISVTCNVDGKTYSCTPVVLTFDIQ